MSEMNNEFEQLLEETSLVTIHNGEVVEGTVISVKEDEIVLNIGYKADGIITRNEYSNQSGIDLRDVVKEGDKMNAKVLKVNDGEGQVLLTYKRLAMEKSNERIREAFENKEVLKAKVVNVLTGGLSVIVDETKIFIPASLVSDTYEKDLSKYAGQEIEFVISEYNPKRRRYIGDRKQLIVAKKAELQKELFEKIKEGDIVSLDIGVIYKGYHSDAARTHAVGEVSEEAKKLIQVTKECFFQKNSPYLCNTFFRLCYLL